MAFRLFSRELTDQGITLVELLVGLVVASLAATAAGSVMLAQIQSSASLELAQRQRDSASRLDYLIQIEAGEAASVVDNPSLPGGCSGGGTGLIAFRIPRDRGSYLALDNVSFVYYYNKGGDVWRCGPRVERSGILNHDSSIPLEAGVAVRTASLEKVRCSGESTNSGQFVYRLVFPTGYQPSCSVARAKTLLICNTPTLC